MNSEKQYQDEYLDIVEASKFLRMSVGALYNFRWQKRIRSFKPGKKILFKRSDLIAFIERSEAPGEAQVEEMATDMELAMEGRG